MNKIYYICRLITYNEIQTMISLKKKLMIGAIPMLFLLAGLSDISARTYKQERRIYLWDVSISMVGATAEVAYKGYEPPRDRTSPSYKYNEGYGYYNAAGDIFVKTRNALVESIRSIKDEKCEIVVIPYVGTMQTPMVAWNAKPSSKETLISQIEAWDNLAKGGNEGGTCLEQVINTYEDAKYNRVILLTDGRDYSAEKLKKIINEWEVNLPGKYRDDRLVYAILSESAMSSNNEIVSMIDAKNADGYDHGVIYLKDLTQLTEYVCFSLGNPDKIEYVIDDSCDLSRGFEIVADCNLHMGYMEAIKCCFSTDDDFIFVDGAYLENGKFHIKAKYKLASQSEYYAKLKDKKTHKVNIKCKIDPTCKDVMIEGSDFVEITLCVTPQPKAIISLSTK